MNSSDYVMLATTAVEKFSFSVLHINNGETSNAIEGLWSLKSVQWRHSFGKRSSSRKENLRNDKTINKHLKTLRNFEGNWFSICKMQIQVVVVVVRWGAEMRQMEFRIRCFLRHLIELFAQLKRFTSSLRCLRLGALPFEFLIRRLMIFRCCARSAV